MKQIIGRYGKLNSLIVIPIEAKASVGSKAPAGSKPYKSSRPSSRVWKRKKTNFIEPSLKSK